jgi:hypothetical protein
MATTGVGRVEVQVPWLACLLVRERIGCREPPKVQIREQLDRRVTRSL